MFEVRYVPLGAVSKTLIAEHESIKDLPLKSLEDVQSFDAKLGKSKTLKLAFGAFLDQLGGGKSYTTYGNTRLVKIFGHTITKQEPLIKYDDIKETHIIEVLIGK